jgi:hypothetical protein
MRIDKNVTSISWIPSEAVTGFGKAIFGTGVTHYDDPPPDVIDDLEAMRDADAFRFANRLSAWIEVDDDGTIADAGYDGGCLMGNTTVALGGRQATFTATAFDDIQAPVEISGDGARFVQTVGGHTALPAPRRVSHPPFVAYTAPTVWTTLALTIHADGSCDHEMIGASTFPRHWVYDEHHTLCAKAGLADYKDWWLHSFGKHTPWGDEDSPAMVTAVETALERELAGRIMRGGEKPSIRTLRKGAVLTDEGEDGDEVFLLLNGVLTVEVNKNPVAEVGPGAILGERALLEGGRRTSTLRAATTAKVAVVRGDQLDLDALREVSAGHRREDVEPSTS